MPSEIKRCGKKGIYWYFGHFNGRRYRGSLRTTEEQRAKREQRARDAKYQEPNFLVKSRRNPTVDDFWQRIEEHDTGKLRPNTVATKKYFWNLLIAFTGAVRLGDITKRDIEAFHKHFVKDAKNEEKKKQTANNALKDISACYNFAIREGLFTGVNPCIGVTRYTLVKKMPLYFEAEELEKLIEEARKISQPLEWVVLLCSLAGLRKKECLCAIWPWFDFQNRMIRISAYPGFVTKTHEDRSVPMNPRIYEALQPHAKSEGFIFGSDQVGTHAYHYDPKKALAKALEKTGLSKVSAFQRLRETFCVLSQRKSGDVYKSSRWLGHASVKTTEKHYAALGGGYDPDIDFVN